MSGVVTLYTAINDAEAARQLARALLEERLIACANILPAGLSLYRWEGKTVEEPETVMLLKTTERLAPEAMARLVALHGYDTPAVLVWKAAGGHQPYLDWIAAKTRPDQE